MPTLSPSQAAAIASGVYQLVDDGVSAIRQLGLPLGCEGLFKVDDNSSFQGRSGALFFKPLSRFGYIAEGEGAHQGEVLLATRGTAGLADGITDFCFAMQRGPSGLGVHVGFHETWKSFVADIQAFMRGRNPSIIHCVGHSLGGALAALNADYLSSIGAGQVKLYTFGSPRVGSFSFAQALTQRMGAHNIFRVSHSSDVVPMTPLFPFQHLPHHLPGLSITNGDRWRLSANAHFMNESYRPGVKGHTWEDLARARAEVNTSAKIRAWLEQSSFGASGFAMGSTRLLGMISDALVWVLTQAQEILTAGVGVIAFATATVLDQLAFLLSRAAALSATIGGYVKTLIAAIFRFLGRTALTGVSLTTAFLRWCLDLLFTSLRAVAVRALSFVS